MSAGRNTSNPIGGAIARLKPVASWPGRRSLSPSCGFGQHPL
jgi:hypothetical protein